MWWLWALAIDQQNKERAAAEAAAAAERAAVADRPRMKAKLVSLGYPDAQANQANAWPAGELERRLPRIEALKAELIGEAQARESIFWSDSQYSAELTKAKKRKEFLTQTAAKSGVPVDVIASAAVGVNPVDDSGNVNWTEARKIEERAQDSIAVYDYDQIEDKLANRGIYLRDLGIRTAVKTPEEAKRVMALLKERGIALNGPAELGNISLLFDWWSQTSSQAHEAEMQRREFEEVKRQERVADWNEVAGWFAGSERVRVNPVLLGQIMIQYESVGPVVRVWQQFLISRGYKLPKYGDDGKFGRETETATMQFQRDYGLKVDGVVGEKTWGMMERLTSPPAPPAPSTTQPSTVSAVKRTQPSTGLKEESPAWLLPAVGLFGVGGALLLYKASKKPGAKKKR